MSETQIPQSVLQSNLSVIRSIADAVRGTFGPQGMDVMLIDQYGDFTITNDGVKVLSLIETTHPAARMVIEAAKTQEDLVGDGTTTVTLLIDSLLSAAVQQIEKGVPIPKLIEGIKRGMIASLEELKSQTKLIEGLDDPKLGAVAMIAGRQEEELVALVMQAAQSVGRTKILESDFQFASMIIARPKAEHELLRGIVINKKLLSPAMPTQASNAKVLVIDDELVPEELPREAVGTSQGFQEFQLGQQNFLLGLRKLVELNVKLVLADSSIHPYAEEIFVEAGILAVQRVVSSQLHKAAAHTRARPGSRRLLNQSIEEIDNHLGLADRVVYRSDLELLCLEGADRSTLIIGAATEEVALEKERIAGDIASAMQAALKQGVVSGGGAVEMALIPALEKVKRDLGGSQSLASFGVDCLVEALKRPLMQIANNLGFNALEKQAEVLAAQSTSQDYTLGLDAKDGRVISMDQAGVFDASMVKSQAIRAACEVAIQILKVNLVIRSRQISG